MIFFLLLGMWALHRGDQGRAAISWALALAAKLLPLLYLPLVIRWLGLRRSLRFLALFSGAGLLCFLPLLNLNLLTHMASSLELYFRQFAFNASLFYLLRHAGLWLKAYPFVMALGGILGLATAAGVAIMAWRSLRPGGNFARLSTLMLFSSCLYLVCASTVHAWYVLVPFALSLLTRWRFPLVWTGLVIFSYSHYANGGFVENYPLILLEYSGITAVFLWEILRPAKTNPA